MNSGLEDKAGNTAPLASCQNVERETDKRGGEVPSCQQNKSAKTHLLCCGSNRNNSTHDDN